MKKRKLLLLLLVVSLTLVLPAAVLAAPQADVHLAWFLPLTGSGGQGVSSNYQADLTIGQAAIGNFSGSGTRIGLGFWQAQTILYPLFLPQVKK